MRSIPQPIPILALGRESGDNGGVDRRSQVYYFVHDIHRSLHRSSGPGNGERWSTKQGAWVSVDSDGQFLWRAWGFGGYSDLTGLSEAEARTGFPDAFGEDGEPQTVYYVRDGHVLLRQVWKRLDRKGRYAGVEDMPYHRWSPSDQAWVGDFSLASTNFDDPIVTEAEARERWPEAFVAPFGDHYSVEL
jgi:hypothetical protein